MPEPRNGERRIIRGESAWGGEGPGYYIKQYNAQKQRWEAYLGPFSSRESAAEVAASAPVGWLPQGPKKAHPELPKPRKNRFNHDDVI
jgi:hypothetical protein